MNAVVFESDQVFSGATFRRSFDSSSITIVRSAFRGNSALGHGMLFGGGGALSLSSCEVRLVDVSFILNSAVVGGAAAFHQCDVIVDGAIFLGNLASHKGGGISCFVDPDGPGFAFLRNVTFKRCCALQSHGAALFVNHHELYCESIYITECRASVTGGGFSLKNCSAFLVSCFFIANHIGPAQWPITPTGAATPTKEQLFDITSELPPTAVRISSQELNPSSCIADSRLFVDSSDIETSGIVQSTARLAASVLPNRAGGGSDVLTWSASAQNRTAELTGSNVIESDAYPQATTHSLNGTGDFPETEDALGSELASESDRTMFEWTDLVNGSDAVNASSAFPASSMANCNASWALNTTKKFEGSGNYGQDTEPLVPPPVFSGLLGQSVLVEQAEFRRAPGPRGGSALFVVQEQDDVTQFELLTDSCIFDGNDSPDVLFAGLCTWLSFQDVFSSSVSSAFALADSLRFCRNGSCGIEPVFFGSTFKGVSAPPATRLAAVPGAPPRTVECDATNEREPSEVPDRQHWTMPPTLTAGGIKLGWMTMPFTRPHRFPSPTVTAIDGRSRSQIVAPSPPETATPVSMAPLPSSLPRSRTALDGRLNLSFTYSMTLSVSQSASLTVSLVESLTNVLTFSVSQSQMMLGDTVSHTLVVYTQWQPSYIPVTTLALTWADFPIWITTHVVTSVYIPVIVEIGSAPVKNVSGEVRKGIMIGIAAGVIVIFIIVWFWCQYARRAHTATTGSDMQPLGFREVMIRRELRETFANPLFCGMTGGDRSVDPFLHDFDPDGAMF
jgi:hypothetical protein